MNTCVFSEMRFANKTYLEGYFGLFLEIINASHDTHQIENFFFLKLFTHQKKSTKYYSKLI